MIKKKKSENLFVRDSYWDELEVTCNGCLFDSFISDFGYKLSLPRLYMEQTDRLLVGNI